MRLKGMSGSLVLFMLALLIPSVILAATGKVRGVVKNAKTGELLMGANVVIQGTSMGAVADENGEYIILNVPVGKYVLLATYMGFQKVNIENLIVNANMTTFRDFIMPEIVLEGKEVVIVAEKPLVSKSATNDIKVFRPENMENLPIRGYASIIGAQVGAVQSGADVYVRGGRSDEVAYFVDGVLMNNPYDRVRTGDISQNALEEVEYQPGGMSAEYGLFNSGVVSTVTKTGGSDITVSGEAITDAFLDQNTKKFQLGTYGYGYNLYALSLSGPIPATNGKLRFFVNAEYNYLEDRSPRWGASVKPDQFMPVLADLLILNPNPVPVYGAKQGNESLQWKGTGNLYYDLKSFKFKVGGSLYTNNYHDYQHQNAPFNLGNMPEAYRNVYTAYGKTTWVINPTAFVEFNANYYKTKYETMDNKHKLDFLGYTDPAKNDNVAGWGLRAAEQDAFARFHTYGRVFGTYAKEEIDRYDFKLDGTWQINKVHELRAGAEAQFAQVRFYNMTAWRLSGNLHSKYVNAAAEGRTTLTQAEIEDAYRSSYADNAGYDITGATRVSSGRDDARRPKTYSAYVQDKMEFRDLVVNLGLRVDHMIIDQQQIKDPANIVIDNNGEIAESNLKPAATYTEFNPRIGMSFPVTDQTVFHIEYGKFTQPPPYNDTYVTWKVLAANLANGNYTTSPNPSLKPVKTTSYEVGFEQQIAANAAIDVTAFYKEIRDQVYLLTLTARPSNYASYVNGDFGNVKGFSFDFRLRRTARVMANLNYTLQWANGTGSDPETQFNIAWQNPGERPTFVSPLDYDQRHTASLNIDFRTLKADGPEVLGVRPLGDFGINLWYQYGSGTAFTPETPTSFAFGSGGSRFPVAAINSAHQPATSTVNLRVDKKIHAGRFAFNPYVWVINLLNTKNVETVYAATGLADDDGYMSTLEGKRFAANNPTAAKWYRYRIDDPENYGEPRQIRVGIRIDYR